MDQVSWRHHFVPQFYLKTWYAPSRNDFWLYVRNEQGAIEVHQRPAKSVGFLADLYTFQPDGLNLTGIGSDELERKFFAPLDHSASQVHKKLIREGVTSISTEEKAIWAVFLNSLLERSPARIRDVEAKGSDVPDTLIAELESRSSYLPTWPSIQAAIAKISKPMAVRNAVLGSLARFIADKEFIEYMIGMTWLTVDFPHGRDHFLTGDMPVVVNGGGQQSPIYMVSIPLSPQRLLVLSKEGQASFDSDFFRKIAIVHNMLIAKQAEEYLVSSREIQDSEHIKYTRIVNEVFGAKR